MKRLQEKRLGMRRLAGGLAGWLAALAVAAIIAPTGALAYEHTVRWTHPAPATVSEFIIHVGSRSGDYTRRIRVGSPPPNSKGIYRWTIELSGSEQSYIAVSAVGVTGLKSGFSNERRVDVDSSEPSTGLGAPGAPIVVSP